VFKKRASRAEFWQFLLLVCSIVIAVIPVSFILLYLYPGSIVLLYCLVIVYFLMFLFLLVTILPFISCWVRRIHDTNKSGWFFLVPVYNIILLFIRGTKGDNRFGNDPYKPIQKEICIRNKHEKRAKIISRLEILGGTLFAAGTTLEEVSKKVVNLQWFSEDFNKWLLTISGALILLPRTINWIKRFYAEDKNEIEVNS